MFLLSGNVNAAWYRDNVSRQVVMPFMPRHLLSGKGGGRGCGGVYFSMTMHQPIQLLWLKMFCTQISNGVACHDSCYISHWVCVGYIGLLHEKQAITASKCCVTVLSLIQKQNNIQRLGIQNVIHCVYQNTHPSQWNFTGICPNEWIILYQEKNCVKYIFL